MTDYSRANRLSIRYPDAYMQMRKRWGIPWSQSQPNHTFNVLLNGGDLLDKFCDDVEEMVKSRK